MKIGIVTLWWSSDNYGQQLQCWALQQALIRTGHEPFLIQYQPGKKCFIEKISSFLRLPLNSKIKSLVTWIGSQHENQDPDARGAMVTWNLERDFSSFREKHLIRSARVFRTIKELKKDPPPADVYIAGSDQIWGCPYDDSEWTGMFLQFGGDSVKRISYAASIGRELSEFEQLKLKSYTEPFSSIGVREKRSQILFKELGRDVAINLDPTLLVSVEQYITLRGDMRPACNQKGYLFVYAVNVTDANSLHWNEASQFVEEACLDVIPVYSSGYVAARKVIPNVDAVYPTVEEWIAYISEANCVLTSSFHGLVFSILFHKPFVAVLLSNGNTHANERMIQILKCLELEDRLYRTGMSFGKQMCSEIDWQKVDIKLSELRRQSVEWLIEALG